MTPNDKIETFEDFLAAAFQPPYEAPRIGDLIKESTTYKAILAAHQSALAEAVSAELKARINELEKLPVAGHDCALERRIASNLRLLVTKQPNTSQDG